MLDFFKRFEAILHTAEEGFAKGAEALPPLVQWAAVVGAVIVLVAQFLPR